MASRLVLHGYHITICGTHDISGLISFFKLMNQITLTVKSYVNRRKK